MKPKKTKAWAIKPPDGGIDIYSLGLTELTVRERFTYRSVILKTWQELYDAGYRSVRVTIEEEEENCK